MEPKENIGAMAKIYFAHLEVKSAAVDQGLPAPTQAWQAKTKKKELSPPAASVELHLEDNFAGARKVLSNHPDEYIAARRKEEAKDPTIQRELSLLQKILNHARISQSFLASLSPFHDRVLLKMHSSSNCAITW